METYYSLDGALWFEYSTFAIETEGMNDLLFYSMDAAGNTEEKRLLAIKIDKTPPSIAISVPCVTKEYVTPSIAVSDNIDLDPKTVLTLDGEPYDGSSPITQEGEHIIVVEAVDDAGNVATRSATFAMDRTHPEARISFDLEGMEIVVLGIDNIDDDVLVEVLSDRLVGRWSRGGVGYEKRTIEYELDDDAGNIMTMKLELLLGWADSYCWSEARVLEVRYDGFQPTAPEWNSYNIAFEKGGGAGESGRVLGQIVCVGRDTMVLAKYDRSKDVTTIALIRNLRIVDKIIAQGLVIVELATDEGGLRCEY